MRLSHVRKSEDTCEWNLRDTMTLSNRSANISGRSELDKSIELLAAPDNDNVIEEAAKAFGQRHVSVLRHRLLVFDLRW